jgi:protein phosphatase 1G
MEFKQNKFLTPDKQILTANPDINTVSLFSALFLQLTIACYLPMSYHSLFGISLFHSFLQVELSDDDDFLVLACDGIW